MKISDKKRSSKEDLFLSEREDTYHPQMEKVPPIKQETLLRGSLFSRCKRIWTSDLLHPIYRQRCPQCVMLFIVLTNWAKKCPLCPLFPPLLHTKQERGLWAIKLLNGVNSARHPFRALYPTCALRVCFARAHACYLRVMSSNLVEANLYVKTWRFS